MDNRDLYELIESYLDGGLPDEQRREVERRMATDKAFREEVELHRALQEDYEDPSRWRLREALSGIMDEPPPPETPAPEEKRPRRRRYWWTAIPAVLLLAGGIWYLMKPGAPAAVPAPARTQPENPPVEQKNEAPSPKNPSQTPNKFMPIAQADPANFAKNASMEALRNLRGTGDISLQMTAPKDDAVFEPDGIGQTRLHFSGALAGLAPDEVLPLNLLIFNNRDADKPLLTLLTQAAADAKGAATFDLLQTVDFPKGLYYFRIDERESGEMLGMGSFFISRL